MKTKILLQREADFNKALSKENTEKPKYFPCVVILEENSYTYVYPRDFYPRSVKEDMYEKIEELMTLGKNNEAESQKKKVICETAPFKPGDVISGFRYVECYKIGIPREEDCNFRCHECPKKGLLKETHLVVGYNYGYPDYSIITRKYTLQDVPAKRLSNLHNLIDDEEECYDHFNAQPAEVIGRDENYLEGVSLNGQHLPLIHTVEDIEK